MISGLQSQKVLCKKISTDHGYRG